MPVSLVLAAAAVVVAWYGVRVSRENWARKELLPEILRLTDEGRFSQAFEDATQAERIIPGDKVLAGLWPRLSTTMTAETDPPGATVSMKDYSTPDAAWRVIG